MNDTTDTKFPAVLEAQIGGSTVQTVNARDLHAFLEVGKDFSNWIKDRIAGFGFVEKSDFEIFEDLSSPNLASSKSRARTTKEYALTLDMAKELAMVERNENGRTVRRYFIACERKLKLVSASLPPNIMEMVRRTDGVSRSTIHKVTEMEKTLQTVMTGLSAIATVLQPQGPILIRRGQTAGQIWASHGFPRIKITCWFGNRLDEAGCLMEGRVEVGNTTIRLFDPDKANVWLRNGGRLLAEHKIAERLGQKTLRLVVREDA